MTTQQTYEAAAAGLGARVRTRREQLELSQEQLAKALRVSQSSIQKMESGTGRPRYLLALASELQTHPANLEYGMDLPSDEALALGRRWDALPTKTARAQVVKLIGQCEAPRTRARTKKKAA